MHTYNTTVRLYDTDAAGLLFFGNHFRIAEAAYETYLESQGIHIGEVLRLKQFIVPLVHAEADYTEALGVGDKLTVEMYCDNISTSSFTLFFRFLKDGELPAATVKTVHVCVDVAKNEKILIPNPLRNALEALD